MPKGQARKATLSVPRATVSEQGEWQEGEPGVQRWAVTPGQAFPVGMSRWRGGQAAERAARRPGRRPSGALQTRRRHCVLVPAGLNSTCQPWKKEDFSLARVGRASRKEHGN